MLARIKRYFATRRLVKAIEAANPMGATMWNQASGIVFCQALGAIVGKTPPHNTRANATHVTLGGSVLYRGWSDKNLDVIVRLGMAADTGFREEIHTAMRWLGYSYKRSAVMTDLAYSGEKRTKEVLTKNEYIDVFFNEEGKRVDLFIRRTDLVPLRDTILL